MNIEFLLAGILALLLTVGHGFYIGEYFILSRTESRRLPHSAFGDSVISKAIARCCVHAITFDYFASAVVLLALSVRSLTPQSQWLVRFISFHLAVYGILFIVVITSSMVTGARLAG